jgi:hypothetical protein
VIDARDVRSKNCLMMGEILAILSSQKLTSVSDRLFIKGANKKRHVLNGTPREQSSKRAFRDETATLTKQYY